jgi:type II secretory pathway component GspD/PulD (secretin)
MSLRPEVSVVSSWVTVPGGGQLPQLTTRKLASTVRVKNGETFVIGGLLEDEDTTTIDKLPILSDLPVLGGLFQHKNVLKTHSEVMIFITPKILANGV